MPRDAETTPDLPAWMPDGSACAALLARLGPGILPEAPDDWPPGLAAVAGMLLRAPAPMVLLWGARGVAIYNDAYAALIAARHPDALGASILEAFPEHAAHNRGVIEAGLTGRATILRAALLPIARDGGTAEEAWWDVDYIPVPGPDGRPGGVLATVTEITQRVRAEAGRTAALRELATERDRLRQVLDGMDGGFVAVDRDRRVRAINAEGLRIDGRPAGEILGRDIADVWPGHLGTGLEPAWRQALEEGRPAAVELRYIDAARGQDVRLETRILPTPDGAVAIYRDVTAARAAEDERARARALVEAIGASIPDLVYAKDRDGRLIYANAAVAALAGLPLPELLGRRDRDWMPDPAEAEVIAAHDRAVMESGGAAEFDEAYTGADGRKRRYRTVKSPLRDGTGAVAGLVGLSGDVTEMRRAQDVLRESEERLRRVLDQIFAYVGVLTLDGALIFANAAPLCAADLGPEDVLGLPFWDCWWWSHDPEGQARLRNAVARAAGGETVRYDAPVRMAGGRLVVIDFQMAPLRDAEGRITHLIASAVPIEERVRAEAELRAINAELEARVERALAERREADALYRAYFENSPEGLFVIAVDEAGGFSVEALNPAQQRGLGLDMARLRACTLAEQLPPEVAAGVEEHYRRVIATGEVQRYDECLRVAGVPRHHETVLVPVRDATGRIARIVGSSRDMTAQIEAEERLRQSHKLEAMGSLTGGVAHDFNNLLTPIIGGLDLLQRRGVGDERLRRLLDGALQSAERARTLVSRLLAFARRQPLQPVPVDLGRLVAGMAELLSSTLGPRIRLEAEVEPGLAPVRADPNQLELALLNLAVNARDAMPEGGSLRIEARAATAAEGPAGLAPGPYARLAVVDTGTGMDAQTLARAVEPFFSTKGVGRGTGLGLSMVHGLARQLGGALALDSRPGGGTTVALWLPFAAGAPAPAGEEMRPSRPQPAGLALLVDDEELVRAAAAAMLAALGWEVAEAASAEAALALVESGLSPDLLVTDHLMPGMTGTDLARRLREGRPSLPVLVVSGYVEDGDVAPDLPRLAKPFRQDELAAALILAAPRSAGPPPAA
jgi:PAS domain S-box-containing protein